MDPGRVRGRPDQRYRLLVGNLERFRGIRADGHSI